MAQTAKAAQRDKFGQQIFDELAALPGSARLTSGQLEAIYALAYARVMQGQYAQALPVFGLLSIYGPTRKHYIAGLALCLQACGRYADAINTYSMLMTLFPGGPEPALQVAECFLALGRLDEARAELGRALRCIAEARGAFDGCKARAHLLMARLSQHAAA